MIITANMIAVTGMIYNCLRIGLVFSFVVLNIIVFNNLIQKRQHRRHCTGCTVLSNVFLTNIISGWIWVGAVIYSVRDSDRTTFLESIICTLQSLSIQLSSYFLLVTMCSICLFNVTRGKINRFGMGTMPWIVTVVLFVLPKALTNGDLGTYAGFSKIAHVQSDDGSYAADFELMMCGQHLHADKFLIGLQYVLIVAPLSAVIVVCSGMLALRYNDVEERQCSLELIYAPVQDEHLPLSISSESEPVLLSKGEKDAGASDESTTTGRQCPYTRMKHVLGAVLMINMIWQCAVRPLMITSAAQRGSHYYLDASTSILVGIQALYLPLYALSSRNK